MVLIWGSCYGWCPAQLVSARACRSGPAAGMRQFRVGNGPFRGAVAAPVTRVFSPYVVQVSAYAHTCPVTGRASDLPPSGVPSGVPSGNVYLPGHPSHQHQHRPQTCVREGFGVRVSGLTPPARRVPITFACDGGGLNNGKGGCVVVAGPGEFAGMVIGQQDLAALLSQFGMIVQVDTDEDMALQTAQMANALAGAVEAHASRAEDVYLQQGADPAEPGPGGADGVRRGALPGTGR